ncbi:hypothetical protein QQX98_013277 [Neonectria punicea]|uniref:Uncharacterized protein n=1 Tax=Neonectria punicea TaxID=979145 RepID=A0ABR1GGK0_9HYPO
MTPVRHEPPTLLTNRAFAPGLAVACVSNRGGEVARIDLVSGAYILIASRIATAIAIFGRIVANLVVIGITVSGFAAVGMALTGLVFGLKKF